VFSNLRKIIHINKNKGTGHFITELRDETSSGQSLGVTETPKTIPKLRVHWWAPSSAIGGQNPRIDFPLDKLRKQFT